MDAITRSRLADGLNYYKNGNLNLEQTLNGFEEVLRDYSPVEPEVIKKNAGTDVLLEQKVNYYTNLLNEHPDPTIQQASVIFLKDLEDIKSSLLTQKLDK